MRPKTFDKRDCVFDNDFIKDLFERVEETVICDCGASRPETEESVTNDRVNPGTGGVSVGIACLFTMILFAELLKVNSRKDDGLPIHAGLPRTSPEGAVLGRLR